MKTTGKMTVLTTAAFLCLAVVGVKAQTTNLVALAIVAETQGASSVIGSNTKTAAPTKQTLKNVNILPLLSQDEYAEGNYNSSNFPAGAKLVALTDGNNAITAFQVLTSSNAFLVDVSDLISVSPGSIGTTLTSGKLNNTTGLASPATNTLQVVSFAYDDSSAVSVFGSLANVTFYVTGLMTTAVLDTTPNASHNYKQILAIGLVGTGEGDFNGTLSILTGGFVAGSRLPDTLP